MKTLELLSHLRSLDVKLWADGDRLHCSAPKGALTPALRTELAVHKAEILAFLHEARRVVHSIPPPLSPVSRSANLPLSFAQQRLWFLDQLEPNSPLYNVPQAIRLQGPLQVKALHQTLNTIVARHETLRTTFHAVDGIPRQVIAEHRTVALPLIDLSAWPEAAREAEAHRLIREEALHPFDLARDVLVRATLLRLGPAEHILLLTMHHIASDGWSMKVLSHEVAALYEAFTRGAPSPLPGLPIQYADYAVWQREWLQGEVLEAQLAYWREQLAGVPELALPLDHPRPAIQTFRGARHALRISQPMTEALKALSQREGVTLFMTLLAAFQTLLQRYTGQDDIAVGSPIAGRTRAEAEGLIGCFVNTLVLRTDLSGNPPFRELLQRVREVALGAHAHQDLPFERLVEALQPERRLSHAPLFQAMFSLENAPRQALHLSGLTLTPLDVDGGTAKFDLTLSIVEEAAGVRATLGYNTDLFEAATMRRVLGHFQSLLEGLVAHPAQRLAELPLLTEPERQQLLVEWNATKAEYPADQCLPQLFEAQVARTPEAIAVVFEDQQLTYRELNDRANQLAHHLRALGVGPEGLVGLYMGRSLEMIVGLLGILKAGGAYVPLDPESPHERLAYLLDDSGAAVLVTAQPWKDQLPSSGAHVVDMDQVDGSSPRGPVDDGVQSANLAYVIYTSGSTGAPKGVAVEHRAACNNLLWMQRQFPLTPADRVPLKYSVAFDVAVWEIFGPLIAGARLVIAPHGAQRDPDLFIPFLREHEITVLDLVPSLLRALLKEPQFRHCVSLRRVTCGGEPLDPDLRRLFFEQFDIELNNMYGPTEATITTTWWTCSGADPAHTVPIGRPIANLQTYLLDANLQPVPIGVPGELHIGGDGLARGYWNRPQLTAETFIPNPFSSEPRARLYKTGDLARYLPDGNIEFLGRLDHQVKIRGFRIELGEIEAALNGHPAVREVVVSAREDVPGRKQLVAYVVLHQEPLPSARELRHFLMSKLPDYMVPAAFVPLERLPLTPNGKVDRRALPTPGQQRPTLEEAFVAPRTPVEEALAGIWADLLGLTQVGIHDNFFELGGHSLLATQVISRLQGAFQVELPLRRLFETPTIAALAQALLAHEAMPGQTEKIAHILKRVQRMSGADVRDLLQQRSREGGQS
jgi:amino acid adenylation domain-containing protein